MRHWANIQRYWQRSAHKQALEQVRAAPGLKLHLGCGPKYYRGYINVDAFSEISDVKADILKLDFCQDNSASLIETHHVLEHLSFADGLRGLREWHAKLAPGGFLIVSVPDFEECIKLWKRSSEPTRWASVVQMIYGSQEHNGMFHKSAYSPKYLKKLLEETGFSTCFVLLDYPHRPTPSFLVLAHKAK